MNEIQFKKNYSAWIDPAYAARYPQESGSKAQKTGSAESTFAQALRKSVEESDSRLTFSKHAVQRMDARQIEVSPRLVAQMDSAVEKARSKGVKEALILNGETAFIVHVPSKTVVTTMNGGEMKENIFTNIDGAVIL